MYIFCLHVNYYIPISFTSIKDLICINIKLNFFLVCNSFFLYRGNVWPARYSHRIWTNSPMATATMKLVHHPVILQHRTRSLLIVPRLSSQNPMALSPVGPSLHSRFFSLKALIPIYVQLFSNRFFPKKTRETFWYDHRHLLHVF